MQVQDDKVDMKPDGDIDVEMKSDAAAAIEPPFRISDGFTPKKLGFHSTRSASLPTAIEPIRWLMPWVMAGLMVYLAI